MIKLFLEKLLIFNQILKLFKIIKKVRTTRLKKTMYN